MDAQREDFRISVNSVNLNKEGYCEREQLVELLKELLRGLPPTGHFDLRITREERAEQYSKEEEIVLPTSYDLQLLREQLLLFDREEEMSNYVETEKILAADPLKQLTELSVSLLRLAKQLLLQRKPLVPIVLKQHHLSRERLEQIQAECLETLMRVRDERRRAQNCCICLSDRSKMVVEPCMHLVLCAACGRGKLEKCPICSQPIRQIREVFQ